MKKLILGSLILTSISFSNITHAGSDSFQIAPAPVPYPKYEADKKTNKYNASYVSMEGDGLEIMGAGFNFTGRQTIKDSKGAFDVNFGLNILSGDFEYTGVTGDLTVMAWNIGFGLEKQILKKKYFSLIGFGGFSLPMFFSSASVEVNGYVTDIDSFGIMYGIPFGVQGGIHVHEKWTLAPFVMFNWILGGSVSTTVYSGGYSTTEEQSIDSYLGYSYGMDIVYEPWNVGIGALMQVADGGGDSGSIDTKIFNISWKQEF